MSIRVVVDENKNGDELINKIVDKVFIIKMFAYSARKKRANGPPAYSTLKPETSSDSPSVRSNGDRLVSARVETNHIRASGHRGKINHVYCWVRLKFINEKPPAKMMGHKIIRAMVTSYEIVWATARNAPIRAYLEFEAHPDPRMV